MTKSMSMLLATSLALAACALDPEDSELGDADADVELGETEQASYSGWVTLAKQYWSAQVRVCKTPTRIYWQFANNTWWNVRTFGDSISNIETYIDGVSSGSKYRTRAGISFSINFWSAGYGAAKLFDIPSMPNC